MDRLLSHKELANSNRTLSMLEEERIKFQFFASMASEIQFEYSVVPSMITISDWGAEKLGISRFIVNPSDNQELLSIISREKMIELDQILRCTTPDSPIVEYEVELEIDGKTRLSRIISHALWTNGDKTEYSGAIGKIVDIQEEQKELKRLKKLASMDPLTNLLNAAYAKKEIIHALYTYPENEYALIIFDLDYFKTVNNERGHVFGDRVLKYLAERLKSNIRTDDLAARIGGDEFLLFVRYDRNIEQAVSRIFSAMTGEYDGFKISVSMGIAKAADVGRNYNDLYHCADLALFDAKRKGQGRYVFYDEKKCNTNAPTTISPMIHPLKNNGGTEYDVGRIISGDCRKLSGYQRTAEKRGAD